MADKRANSKLFSVFTMFLVLLSRTRSHPTTQDKPTNVHSRVDGGEILRSALVRSVRNLESHITPISPELEQEVLVAKIGRNNRIGRNENSDTGVISESRPVHHKRHTSVGNQGHQVIAQQNIKAIGQEQFQTDRLHQNQNQPLSIVSLRPTTISSPSLLNHNQNSQASIVSLRPAVVSNSNLLNQNQYRHSSTDNFRPATVLSNNLALNANKHSPNPELPINFVSSGGIAESNQNRQTSGAIQDVRSSPGFNNGIHQSSINNIALQSSSNNSGFPSNIKHASHQNGNTKQAHNSVISKGILESVSEVALLNAVNKDASAIGAGHQPSIGQGVPQTSASNHWQTQDQKVNVIQGGSVVQHHSSLLNNNDKVTDSSRANLAQRLSSVLAINKESNNNEKNTQNIRAIDDRDQPTDAGSRQLTVHRPRVTSQNPAPTSQPIASGPCVAAFSVRKGLADTTDKAKPRRLTFQDVLTNTGGWSKQRHQFEVPCTGLYFFSFNAISTKNSDFTLALMKDGRYQVTAYGGKEGYLWGGNSALLFLTPGEKVYLELQQGELYEHPHDEAYTTFSGFLINSL